MRSYGQYCSVARALDVIGDRWSLLIVRELLLQGRCRYTDLLNGLPGIATNLLADRLQQLEQAGIVDREAAPPPVATTLFGLTPRGEQLQPVLRALGVWGAPCMAEPADHDAFRSHWLAFPVSEFLCDAAPDDPPVTIELHTGDRPTVVETVDGRVRTRPGPADHPDLVLTGSPQVVLGVLTAAMSLTAARHLGLRCRGNPKVLRRLQRREPALTATDGRVP